jgi:hypothetical protein
MGDTQLQLGEIEDVGPLALSKSEQQVLQLYEKLMEVRLQAALLKAQRSQTSGKHTLPRTVYRAPCTQRPSNSRLPLSPASSAQDISEAQQDLLAARSLYNCTQAIDESLLIANPTLRAVHGATNASPIEK